MTIQELIGRALSAAVAPFAFLASLLRGDRIFHPDGVVYRAEVFPLMKGGTLGQLAQRMSGTALVRLSGGLWAWPRSRRGPEVLGVAARFGVGDALTPDPQPGMQDLLFVTAQSVPGLMVAPFTTNVRDFMNNRYYALLPFTLADVGEVYLRLVPERRSPPGMDRQERLVRAVAQGTAVMRLEIQVEGTDEEWLPIAAIRLREQLPPELDDEFRFDPGTTGMGLVPRGLLQWMRPGIYEASQAGRAVARRRTGKK